jgi:hypothetical protein
VAVLRAAAARRDRVRGDVEAVRARQRELGVPEAFEWVHETTPALLALMREAGMTCSRRR